MGTHVEATPSTPLPSSSSSNAFLETVSLLDELIAVFDNQEEAKTLNQGCEKLEELGQVQQRKVHDWKGKLKALQTRVDEALQKTKGFESEEEYQKKLEMLEKEKQSIISEIMKAEEDCSLVESQLDSVKNEEQRYLQLYTNMCDEMNKEIPRMQYLLSLYADISRLRTKSFFSSWDQLEDVFSGYILSKKGDDIQPFEFPIKANTSFTIVNQLWEMFERTIT
ncbi:hypothetical protein Gasu2_55910 [Galdieria sulphuraria]|uniref:Kinetochore protein Spc24 n=1 Tax=Galdieria sulphuraria TaxID=130081 RepID=M2Y011_GALSU|nr:uncharacterized protein Gasu_33760 [Galdieria sulphuraria]EME29174.1 hypothetical protein Gasu_33760 [Galdieria sulphuraria]GJD11453.1 hypothetical protein Gasu2_55910 [Galdieria sulphuraria]|eukprot:XP_005705694.1 hypothetical protein Gasu_33760 [Galdieria sulphuraria]